MKHVILTRFNLPTRGQESIVRAEQDWLAKRSDLFKRYCLPSVRNQTTKDFEWLIYLDPQSPKWLLDEMATIAEEGAATPILRESVTAQELLADINKATGRTDGALTTTNLDNDDALAPDFIERVQRVDHPHPCAVYVVNGIIRTPRGLYRRHDAVNAFCSVIDYGWQPKTCWQASHNVLPSYMPSVELTGQPGWLQVVHGSNVSNRVHGRLINSTEISCDFPGIDDLPEPGRLRLTTDRLLLGPLRAAREFPRRHLKQVLIALGGQSAIEKARWVRGKVRQLLRNR